MIGRRTSKNSVAAGANSAAHEQSADEADSTASEQSTGRAFAGWMGSMWLYTSLRFALFFALWGILVLVGLKVLFAALLGLVLSVPLSLVLLAKPRRAFTANLEARVDARRVDRAGFDAELDPDAATRDEDLNGSGPVDPVGDSS